MARQSRATRAKMLSDKLAVDVDQHPFDIGYWSFYARLPRPDNSREAEGWDEAENEQDDEEPL